MKSLMFCLVLSCLAGFAYADESSSVPLKVEGGKSGSSASIPAVSLEITSNSAYQAQSAAASCGSNWWISGNHEWEWKSYYAYLKASIKGRSKTFLGDSESACDTPLVVDKLEVIGETVSWNGDAQIKVRMNRALNNMSQIYESKSDRRYGVNLTKGPCGAITVHRATKDGTTWLSRGKSGCGGKPGAI